METRHVKNGDASRKEEVVRGSETLTAHVDTDVASILAVSVQLFICVFLNFSFPAFPPHPPLPSPATVRPLLPALNFHPITPTVTSRPGISITDSLPKEAR